MKFFNLRKDKTQIRTIWKRTLPQIHSVMASQNSYVWYRYLLTIPSAVDYTSVFSAQATATYSAVSTGASPSDAVLASVTAVAPGNGAPGVPRDPNEQGNIYNIDHILELQFVVGAFSVNPRPYALTPPRAIRDPSRCSSWRAKPY